jgi:hypothetical protein
VSRGSAKRALSSTGGYCNAQEEEKSQIDKHIQLKADIVLAESLLPGAKLDGFGLYSESRYQRENCKIGRN